MKLLRRIFTVVIPLVVAPPLWSAVFTEVFYYWHWMNSGGVAAGVLFYAVIFGPMFILAGVLFWRLRRLSLLPWILIYLIFEIGLMLWIFWFVAGANGDSI
jgi:hypothetical protein